MQLDLPFSSEISSGFRVEPPTTPSPRDPSDGIEFVRMRRARRYIMRVRPDGTLRVTIPRGGSRAEAAAFVRRQASWIARERARVSLERAPARWTDGSTILIDGEPQRIEVTDSGDGLIARYAGRSLRVETALDVRGPIERDLREQARARLVPRLLQLAEQHGLRVSRVTVRNQRSRWGSCSRAGAIALNFRLLQMPPAVRDYVLVHELMHLREQNHGRRFWKLVERACPAFRDAERWLREAGRGLF